MALTNVVKDTEYINKLIEMKRYYRSEAKFKELVDIADKELQESDYTTTWRNKREELIKYLKDYFQLELKFGSSITLANTESNKNNNSYSYTIEIIKSPIKPKYAIGTDEGNSIEV